MQELTTIVESTLEVLILGWIDAKMRKSGSQKTRIAYQTTLAGFRTGLSNLGLDLDSKSDQELATIALTAQAFAGFSARGREIRPATRNQRLAILSSFYEYCIRQGFLTVNPIARVERSKVQLYAKATPLDSDDIAEKLAQINRSLLSGKRDYALLAVLFQTGRRLAEVAVLELCNLVLHNGKITATFEHCKGGKVMRDKLSYAATNALIEWLYAFYGDIRLGDQEDRRPVWLALSRNRYGLPLGTQSIADVCEKWLGTSKVHVTRHSWAHEMEKAGAHISMIQARLGHESLATTGRYLAALKQAENPFADRLADIFFSRNKE